MATLNGPEIRELLRRPASQTPPAWVLTEETGSATSGEERESYRTDDGEYLISRARHGCWFVYGMTARARRQLRDHLGPFTTSVEAEEELLRALTSA